MSPSRYVKARVCDHVLMAEDWNCGLGKDLENSIEVRHSFSFANESSDNGVRLVKLASSEGSQLLLSW